MTDDDGYISEDDFNLAFRKRLAETRTKDMDISQKEMAKRLRCSEDMYPKYETRSPFPLYLLPRLIVETDKPYSYWIFGVRPPEQSKDRTRSHLKSVK